MSAGSAEWKKDSAASFQALFVQHFGMPSETSMFTADFTEPGYKVDGTYDYMDETTLRSKMRNGLLNVDLKGGATANLPSSRYSNPLLTRDQKLLLGAAQWVAVEPRSTVPVLSSIFPYMMDYTSKETETLFKRIEEGKGQDVDQDQDQQKPSQSRMTLGREYSSTDLDSVKAGLEEARQAGLNLFKREVTFQGGTMFVRIFKGREFFEIGHPSVYIRFEMIAKGKSSGVNKEDRKIMEKLSGMQFNQTRFLDVRLAILLTSMVEQARLSYDPFFSPPLRVARICTMQGEAFSVIVNDAWTGNLQGWITSFKKNKWRRAMQLVEKYLAQEFIDKKLHYLNSVLNIQHGDLKVDNVVYLNTKDGTGKVVPHFGFIDFGLSSLYKDVQKGKDGILRERIYRSSLFVANTAKYLDPWLDASYLQYSLRFSFLRHFGVETQENAFFDAHKNWFPLIGKTPKELLLYKWRLERYAGVEQGKAWIHEGKADNLTGNQMNRLEIMDLNKSPYPDAELDMTITEIARRRLASGVAINDDFDSQDEPLSALEMAILESGGMEGLETLASIKATVYREVEDDQYLNYYF